MTNRQSTFSSFVHIAPDRRKRVRLPIYHDACPFPLRTGLAWIDIEHIGQAYFYAIRRWSQSRPIDRNFIHYADGI